MKKTIIKSLVVLMGLVGLLFLKPVVGQAQAAPCGAPTTGFSVSFPSYPDTQSHTITLDMSSNFDDTVSYHLNSLGFDYVTTSLSFPIDQNISGACNDSGCISVQDKIVTWEITNQSVLGMGTTVNGVSTYTVNLFGISGFPGNCQVGEYQVTETDLPGPGCSLEIFQNQSGGTCYQNQTMNACFQNNTAIGVTVTDLVSVGGDPWNGPVGLRFTQEGGGEWPSSAENVTNGGPVTLTFSPSVGSPPATITGYVESRGFFNDQDFPGCDFTVEIENGCNETQCEPPTTITPNPVSVGPDEFKLCNQIADESQKEDCLTCAGGEQGEEGIWTAIGCIKKEPEEIVGKLIRLGLGIGGGVALLMILSAGFMLTVSQGNPQKTGQAKEMVTAAVTGLLFIIFSVTILQFIGFSVLKIPGFGGP